MFNRSRFIAPIIITLFTYWFIRTKLQFPLEQAEIHSLFTGLNVLFCMQLIATSVLPEKGMMTRYGISFLLFLGFGDALLFLWGDSILVIHFWQNITLPIEINFTQHFWLSPLILLCHGITALILGIKFIWLRRATEVALFLTWSVGFMVFVDFATTEISSLGFSALLIALFITFQQSNYQVSFMDALTGIASRRAMDDYLSTLGRSYSIAMLDIDHFKKFNDTHGHDVGDQVLRMVANKINLVSGGGRAFRYGGEEFMVIFNRRNANDCYVFLEAVRESIQHYKLTLRSENREVDTSKGKANRQKTKNMNKEISQALSVTISIGIANSAKGLKPKDIIKLADENLYKAKKAGRNQTIRPEIA